MGVQVSQNVLISRTVKIKTGPKNVVNFSFLENFKSKIEHQTLEMSWENKIKMFQKKMIL